MFFVTISSRPEDYEKVFDIVKSKLIDDDSVKFMVKEIGKNGTHPHIHYIVESTQRNQDYTRKVINWFKKVGVLGDRLVRTRTVKDIDGILIYMNKDEHKEILKNTIQFDIEKLKAKGRFIVPSWKYVPTFLEAPLFIKEYVKQNDLKVVLSRDDLGRVFKHMVNDRIAVHHLYKKEEDLVRCLRDLNW